MEEQDSGIKIMISILDTWYSKADVKDSNWIKGTGIQMSGFYKEHICDPLTFR